MKSTTRLQFSVLSLSAITAIVLYAVLALSIPQFGTSTNSTTPASPATYSPTANYSFQLNFTEPNGAMANASFQLGSPSGSLANYTDNTTGLVGYWRLNSVNGTNYTKDFSGYGNDGQLMKFDNGGNPPSQNFTAGKIGNALSFDGVDDYVDAGNGASLNITNAITVSAWVKPASIPANRGRIVFKYSPGSYDLEINNLGNFFSTSFYQTNSWQTISGSTTSSINKWYHVIFVYSGSQMRLYVNGISDANPINLVDTLYSSTADTIIGTNIIDFGQSFNGTLDEVRIYNRSLSAAEVAAQYAMQYPYYAGNDNSLNGTWAINFTQPAFGGAGTYNYTWFGTNTTGGQNKSDTINYVINKLNNVSLRLAINGTESDASYTYGTVSNATAWTNSSVGSIILYRNGTNVGNPENNTLAAKAWNYTPYFSHENYSANGVTRYLTISKAATLMRLFLNGTEGNRNYNISQTANFTVTVNISGKTIYLNTNLSGWSVASGATPLFNYTQLQSTGIYNITGYFLGDENYSASSATYFANVTGIIANITLNLALHLGAAFADDSLQAAASDICISDGSGWFGLTAENPASARSGNLSADYNLNVSFSSNSAAFLAIGKGGCTNFRRYVGDAQLKRFLSPLMSFSYAKTNLIQLILQFNGTHVTNDAHWGKGTYLLSIANQGYNSSSAKQNLGVKVVK